MKKTLMIAATAIAATSGAAFAQGAFEGAITAGYSSGAVEQGGGSQDLSSLSLRMHSTVTFGNNFLMGVNIGARQTDVDGTPIEIDMDYFAFSPRYRFTNGLELGVYYETVNLGVNLLPIGAGNSSYGLTLGKDFGRFNVEGYLGQSDYDLLNILAGGSNALDLGVRGNFAVSDKFTLGAHLIRSTIEPTGTPVEIAVTSFGVGGQYAFTDAISIFGSLSQQNLDTGILGTTGDATRYGLGGAYAFNASGTMPVIASLEFVRTDISSGGTSANLDEWRLGVTFPLGNSAHRTPLNSTVRQISDGGRSAVSQFLSNY